MNVQMVKSFFLVKHCSFFNSAGSIVPWWRLVLFSKKERTLGEFQWTRISGNSGSKSIGTERFRKFFSKFSVHLSKVSFLRKFRKLPLPFGISTRYESASVNRERLQESGESSVRFEYYTGYKIKWSAIVRTCSWSPILHGNVTIWFPGKLWTGRSEFPVSQFTQCACSPARKVRTFLSSHMSGSIR